MISKKTSDKKVLQAIRLLGLPYSEHRAAQRNGDFHMRCTRVIIGLAHKQLIVISMFDITQIETTSYAKIFSYP